MVMMFGLEILESKDFNEINNIRGEVVKCQQPTQPSTKKLSTDNILYSNIDFEPATFAVINSPENAK